jgi:hypothetical protein
MQNVRLLRVLSWVSHSSLFPSCRHGKDTFCSHAQIPGPVFKRTKNLNRLLVRDKRFPLGHVLPRWQPRLGRRGLGVGRWRGLGEVWFRKVSTEDVEVCAVCWFGVCHAHGGGTGDRVYMRSHQRFHFVRENDKLSLPMETSGPAIILAIQSSKIVAIAPPCASPGHPLNAPPIQTTATNSLVSAFQNAR